MNGGYCLWLHRLSAIGIAVLAVSGTLSCVADEASELLLSLNGYHFSDGLTFDAGIFGDGEQIVFDAVLENHEPSDIVLKKLEAIGACTVPDLSDLDIAPAGQLPIHIEIDRQGRIGRFTDDVLFHFTCAGRKQTKRLSVNWYADLQKFFRHSPVSLGTVRRDAMQPRTVTVPVDEAIQGSLLHVSTMSNQLQATLLSPEARTGRVDKVQLQLSLVPDVDIGPVSANVYLRFEEDNVIVVPVTAIIEHDKLLFPPILLLQGNNPKARLKVRAPGPVKHCQIPEIEDDAGLVDVKIEEMIPGNAFDIIVTRKPGSRLDASASGNLLLTVALDAKQEQQVVPYVVRP